MEQRHATNILLTGRPGCGKTTVIVRLAECLAGRRIAGFYTQEVREGGRRTGFGVRTFGGAEGTLSSVHFTRGPRVGRYRVDVEGFEAVIAPELWTPPEQVNLFLVDEIGKMECFSRRFVAAMRRILDAPVPVVATVAMKGGGFIAEVRQRPDVALLEVTHQNRDALPRDLARRFTA